MTNETRLIWLLFIIMLLKGALWSLAFPLWQGPDEDDHYAVIQFIGELGRLPAEGDELLPDEITLSRQIADVGRLDYDPTQRQAFGQTPLGPNESQFDQLPRESRASFALGTVGKLMHATPLYYMGAAVVYRLFDEGNLLWRVQIQRFLAVLIGAPLVWVAYLTTRELFPAARPSHHALRLTIPTLVAFHPLMSEITAVVSADGLLILAYSLLIYQSILVLKHGLTRKLAIAIAITFVVGNLTKPTLNGYVPLVALLVGYDWWRTRSKTVITNALLMNALIIPPMLWWMQRSLRLNDDLFYFNPILKGHRILQNPFYDYTIWNHAVDFYQSIWGGMLVTWWGHFGWLDTPLAPWVYDGLRWLTVAAVVGLVVGLFRRKGAEGQRGGGAEEHSQLTIHNSQFTIWKSGSAAAPLPVWLFLALTLLIPVLLLQVYDLSFWWQYGNGRGMQGRYWLGTIVPMLTFFTVGLLCLVPVRWQAAVHNLLRLGITLLNLASLFFYILPRYYL
ncbi:MAG: glycosyltransferase family 39 protein [Chloroflexi bacterium]|nr:glycosyltransferase family 39 protein [Chloroflexota bacterium]